MKLKNDEKLKKVKIDKKILSIICLAKDSMNISAIAKKYVKLT